MPSDGEGPKLSRGEFGLLLLSLLSKREMYGYELIGQLRATSEGAIDLPEGTVYPALRRLERDGLIQGRWETVESAPRRRYYALTPKGHTALAAGRRDWHRFRSGADTVMGT